MRALLALLLLALAAPTADAQVPAPPPVEVVEAPRGPRRLSGPRIGFTVLNQRLVDRINETFGDYDYDSCTPTSSNDCREEVIGSVPVISQFGWQWERRMFQLESGTTGVSEIVVLVGGAEYGILIPSASLLVGMRMPGGFEFGLGPNVAATSIGYALTVGHTQDLGELAFPVNAAVVLGPDGPRASLLVGVVISDRYY